MADKKTEGMLGSYDANGNYVDPYGVTFYDGFTGKNLNNADTEKSAYGDDSTLATYNTGNNKGGTNDKYTGENTRNTYTGYNADIKTADLNPDYQYGGLAQQQESIDNSYIANRNDNIASALYNEGRRSIEDVADFLNQQAGFQNSTAEQRQNTINSVWKRIGQIEAENQKNNEQPADPNKTPEGEKNEALNNMESDLNKSTAGELYGKVTADQSTAIKTLEDENSVYRSMNEARIQTFKNLQAMDSNSIASAIISGVMASDSQQMRDLMQYDPAKYQEVKQAEKQIRGQMNINTITSGEGEWNTTATNGQSGLSNEVVDFASNSSNGAASTADILKSVNSTLDSNQAAATASEQMATIEADMATLQNRMKNLKTEANKVFKGDVPQYIVNAYIANRTAEIQDQLSILENRYNAAYSRYQNEWEQTKWNAEYKLKQEELDLKKQSMVLDQYAKEQGIALDWAELGMKYGTATTGTSSSGKEIQLTTLSREEIGTTVDSLVEACTNGQLGNAQCAAGIQKYYLPYLGVDLGTLSAYSAKQGICNETDLENYTPQKGDLVVMSSPTQPKYGHIGMVVSVDGDTLTYLDWNGSIDANGNGTETAKVRSTKVSNSRIYGYYNPTKGQSQGGATEGGYYNPNYAEIYGNFLRGKYSAGKQLETTAQSLGISIDELRNQANAWKASQNNNEDATRRLHAIEYVLNTGLSRTQKQTATADNRAGGIDRFFSGGAGDFASQYKYIKDNITFDKLLELKKNGATFGALSDNELRAIGNAAMALNTNMTTEEFEKQLTWIYNELRRGMGEDNNWTTEQIKSAYNGNSNTSTKRASTTRTTTANTTGGTQGNMSASDKAKALQGL